MCVSCTAGGSSAIGIALAFGAHAVACDRPGSLRCRIHTGLCIFSAIGTMVALLDDKRLNNAVDAVMVAQQLVALVRGLEQFLSPSQRLYASFFRMLLFDWCASLCARTLSAPLRRVLTWGVRLPGNLSSPRVTS